jgi:DNA-binding transcriptional MerR regulator
MSVKAYTVSQLAKMAGVSVRTLHHYDQIGLLEPSARTEAGYRLYVTPELLRLQQLLFFKELDMPLDEVRRILDDPGFDQVAALEHHRQLLHRRMERLTHLLRTIDRTIDRLTEDDMTLTDEELYEEFTTEQIENFYSCSAEMYRGLGQGYAEHPEFRAFYEKYRPGLADFMSAAMNHYADQVLDKREP